MKWLRTSGDQIVAPGAGPVQLRGCGVGGWLNMENFITGYPGTESAHRQALRRVLGPDRYALLFDALLANFFGPDDADFLASLGFNCVRIPVNYRDCQERLSR
jgi:endoglucanase